jgi:hypothetical protein
MDEYAFHLTQRVLAAAKTTEATVTVSADALRAAAQDRDTERGSATPPAKQHDITASGTQDVGPIVSGTTQYLRLALAMMLTLVAVSATVVGGTLLPGAVQSTTARVWIGLGLAGGLLASIAGISLYVIRTFGEDAIGGFLRRVATNQPRGTDHGE